jgi:hypothetical protein
MANIAAAGKIAMYLTSLLNTNITTMEVFDEMFLIEHGMCGDNKVLNAYVKKAMLDYMTPKTQADFKRLKAI